MFTSTIPKADKDTKTSLSTTTVGPHSPDKKSVFTIPSAERYAVGAAAGTTRCYSFASFLVHITSSGIGFLGSNSSIIKGTEKKQMLNCSQCWFKNVSLVFFSFLSRASHLFQWKQIYFFFLFFYFCLSLFFTSIRSRWFSEQRFLLLRFRSKALMSVSSPKTHFSTPIPLPGMRGLWKIFSLPTKKKIKNPAAIWRSV